MLYKWHKTEGLAASLPLVNFYRVTSFLSRLPGHQQKEIAALWWCHATDTNSPALTDLPVVVRRDCQFGQMRLLQWLEDLTCRTFLVAGTGFDVKVLVPSCLFSLIFLEVV